MKMRWRAIIRSRQCRSWSTGRKFSAVAANELVVVDGFHFRRTRFVSHSYWPADSSMSKCFSQKGTESLWVFKG
jgi:hypothetical protein